jgi:hypothetical protein
MGEDEQNYVISQNPYAPEVTRKIPKDEVTGQKMSTVSLMPVGTVNRLNEEELRNLIAYLVAGGNPDNPVYSDGEANLQASR